MEATASVGSTRVGEAWQDRLAPSSITKQTAQLRSCQIRSARSNIEKVDGPIISMVS